MFLNASVAVSPTPRAIGWSLKLSMSCFGEPPSLAAPPRSKVSSPAGMSARIFSMTR
jgi:hypothetical protein